MLVEKAIIVVMGNSNLKFDQISPDASSGNFLAKVAKEARQGICTLYKISPGALVPNVSDYIIRALMDNFCSFPSAPGLPNPPAPPFTGGQCDNVSYRVEVVSETANYPGYTPGTLFTTRGAVVLGPISSITYEYRRDAIGYQAWIMHKGGTTVLGSDGGGRGWLRLRSIKVTRADNQPDTCGSLPPQFPPAPFPGNPNYNYQITIILNDGTTKNFNVSLKPPALPTLNTSILDLNIENLNINLKVDLGGVTINFPPSNGGANLDEINDKLDDLKNNTDQIKNKQDDFKNDFDNYRDNFDDYRDDFKDYRDEYRFDTDPPPPNPNEPDSEYDFNEETDKNSDEKDQIERLEWVIVDLTEYPKNIKRQFGGQNAPELLYAGWIQFRVTDRNLPREPIHFSRNIFKAPPGATGYAYTLYIGITADVSTITKKETEP